MSDRINALLTEREWILLLAAIEIAAENIDDMDGMFYFEDSALPTEEELSDLKELLTEAPRV